jgi:chromosome partitioning protein
VDIIPSELDLAGAEIDVARTDKYLHCFINALKPLLQPDLSPPSETPSSLDNRYDIILVDCPPSLGILTMNALSAADSVVIPIQCEYYALEGLTVITQLLDRLRQIDANNQIDIEGVLMTMYDSRTRLSGEVVNEVRKHFGAKVYKSVIPRNVRLSEAPSFGIPIIQYAKHSSGSRAYRKFAKEFLNRVQKKETQLAKEEADAAEERQHEATEQAADTVNDVNGQQTS